MSSPVARTCSSPISSAGPAQDLEAAPVDRAGPSIEDRVARNFLRPDRDARVALRHTRNLMRRTLDELLPRAARRRELKKIFSLTESRSFVRAKVRKPFRGAQGQRGAFRPPQTLSKIRCTRRGSIGIGEDWQRIHLQIWSEIGPRKRSRTVGFSPAFPRSSESAHRTSSPKRRSEKKLHPRRLTRNDLPARGDSTTDE